MKNTEKAFHWIISILEKHNIKYKISGGFAARIYGVNRGLADIDIEVPNSYIKTIYSDTAPCVIFGPDRYKDNNWDLELMTLVYEGQEIDIAGINAKIFNKQNNEWENSSGDLDTVAMKEVFGKVVPIETLDSLIRYKIKIGREVDIEDVNQLKSLWIK